MRFSKNYKSDMIWNSNMNKILSFQEWNKNPVKNIRELYKTRIENFHEKKMMYLKRCLTMIPDNAYMYKRLRISSFSHVHIMWYLIFQWNSKRICSCNEEDFCLFNRFHIRQFLVYMKSETRFLSHCE